MFIGEFPAPEVWEIGQVYLLKADIPLDKMKLQEEEVSEVKWITFEEFKNLFFSDEFMPYGENYKKWICEKLNKTISRQNQP